MERFDAIEDRIERAKARKGKSMTSLWLPGNLMVNSRYYEDPELKAKHTSNVRTIKDPAYEAELLQRERNRKR